MNDMLQKVKEKYSDFDITSRHISNIVRDNNITLKLTRFRHEPTKTNLSLWIMRVVIEIKK